MAKQQQQIPEGQDTEKKILAAARGVFHRRGFAGARMQEIADEAGINKALLHYYFRSKEQLFKVIFQEAMSHILPYIAQILSSELPLEEKIEKFVHGYIDTMAQHPYLPGFVLHEINTEPRRLISIMPFDRFNIPDLLTKQIRMAVEQGRIRDIPPRQFIASLIGLCVFPFAARPLLQFALNMPGDEQFAEFLDERAEKRRYLKLLRMDLNPSGLDPVDVKEIGNQLEHPAGYLQHMVGKPFDFVEGKVFFVLQDIGDHLNCR